MGIVRACLTMVPVLMAEESLRDAERISVGVGVDPSARPEIVRRWRREADRFRAVAVAATPDQLASMGIGYRIVEKKA